MNKYHVYEKDSEIYICDVYSYTDFLNLQLFMKEKGTDIFATTMKMSKQLVRKVFKHKST
jgi:hypothetical protein